MRERPILFSAPMVRAIFDGRKTVTRRIVKPYRGRPIVNLAEAEPTLDFSGRHNDPSSWGYEFLDDGAPAPLSAWPELCPYGQPGDRLWVRETFVIGWTCSGDGIPMQFDEDGNELPAKVWYRATSPDLHWVDDDGSMTDSVPWKPSIHMPRWASRITLEVTAVRVERLQDITYEQAIAEGIPDPASLPPFPPGVGGGLTPEGYSRKVGRPQREFRTLWESINGAGSWDANPWVRAVEFKRIEQEAARG